MKKTFTANLNGTVFHIEEDAYDQLQRYLANIRAKFSGSSEAEEIMADIEARIAELFNERLQDRQAVSMADVDHVKRIMGQPEDYVDGDETDPGAHAGQQSHSRPGPRKHKRLFRDTEDRWIGGVIGGVANYFGVDPLWFRIGFLAVFFAGWGTPLLIYVLMWALVPEASTAAEKLVMRGKPVTVDNIKRVFDEGTEQFKAGASKVAGEARDMGRKYWNEGSTYGHGARNQAEGIVLRVLEVFGKLVGVVLLMIAIILGLSWIAAVVGSTAAWTGGLFTGGTGLMGYMGFIFPGMGQALGFSLALSILVLVPVILLLLAALWLMFRVQTPRWAGWVLTVLFILALAAITFLSVDLARDFRRNGTVTSGIELPAPKDGTLRIAATQGPRSNRSFSFNNGVARFNIDFFNFEGDSAHVDLVGLRVQQSPDSTFHLVTARVARGASEQKATERASHITTSYVWKDDMLRLSKRYSMPLADLMRVQQVNHVLQLPIGGKVYFTPSCTVLLNDCFDTNREGFELDDDMLGRTWIMTANGLQPYDPLPQQQPSPAPGTPSETGKSPVAFTPATATLSLQMPNLVHLLTSGLRP